MNSGKNIKNALSVLYNTYDNIQKLMEYCKAVAKEETNYEPSEERFLRYKSDNDCSGWLLSDFILLFQNKHSPNCESENGWKNDAVYVLEICLGEKHSINLPTIYLSKFDYGREYINKWSRGCSPAQYWAFYNPLRNKSEFDFTNFENYIRSKPKDDKTSISYLGLKQVTIKKIDLMSITSDNLKEMIFDEFDRLAIVESLT